MGEKGVYDSWDDGYKKKKKMNINYFKLKDGERASVVITSDQVIGFGVHYVDKKFPYRCTKDNTCVLCKQMGKRGQDNWLVNVFDFRTKENKIWGFRGRVKEQLKEIKEMNDNSFEGLIINVKREGIELQTSYVLSSRNLKDAEKEQVKAEPIDLKDLIPPIYDENSNYASNSSNKPSESTQSSVPSKDEDDDEAMINEFLGKDDNDPF